MSCSNSCNEGTNNRPSYGNSYVCIVVLYILLAIIIGTFIY